MPLCKSSAHTRSSHYSSEKTKKRYHQCTNINCGHTFKTLESITGSIVKPSVVAAVVPHECVSTD
ncbi:MAG: ogr/Delta-like zinc finger family protein [Sodalis sp. (in: enterobacteria)]|uniref:ogr/Delta-like zinc finger family protein n=1 Tax=Sodalis sp. (in: enterobacteria) TaxID=1898979 RepID=UPI003F419D5B